MINPPDISQNKETFAKPLWSHTTKKPILNTCGISHNKETYVKPSWDLTQQRDLCKTLLRSHTTETYTKPLWSHTTERPILNPCRISHNKETYAKPSWDLIQQRDLYSKPSWDLTQQTFKLFLWIWYVPGLWALCTPSVFLPIILNPHGIPNWALDKRCLWLNRCEILWDMWHPWCYQCALWECFGDDIIQEGLPESEVSDNLWHHSLHSLRATPLYGGGGGGPMNNWCQSVSYFIETLPFYHISTCN